MIQGINPRGKSIQFECSMPMVINCMIHFQLKIHENSHAEQKYFLYKNKNEKINFYFHIKYTKRHAHTHTHIHTHT